jgi:hypothetical protein
MFCPPEAVLQRLAEESAAQQVSPSPRPKVEKWFLYFFPLELK